MIGKKDYQAAPISDADFLKNTVQVPFDRAFTQIEVSRDHLVWQTVTNECHDMSFAICQC
jgi:hypothetical protein